MQENTYKPSPVVERDAKNARTAILIAQYALAAWAILTVIAGLVIATRTGREDVGILTTRYEDTHPFVASGIGVIVAGLITTAFGFAILFYLDWRMSHETWRDRQRGGAA